MITRSWQRLLLLAALALLVTGVTACSGRALAAPAMEESPTVAPQEPPATEEQVSEPASTDAEKAQPAATGYQSYVAVMPAASGGGTRVMVLRLFDDGTLTWQTQFQNGEPAIVEVGTWTGNADGTLTVNVTGQTDRVYDAPNVIVFQQTDGMLVATQYDQNLYGSEGLQLRSVKDVAAGVEASLFTLDLAAGFPLDPTFMSVNAGGAVPADLLGPGCTGFVNTEPVVTLNWTGATDFLKVFFVSNDDPTLVVLTPDGQALCNDDANSRLLDPVVQISNPVTGTYRIWAGSYTEGNLLPGILVLTTKPNVGLGTFNLGTLIQRAQIPEVVSEPPAIASPEDLAQTLQMALADSPKLTEADLPATVDIVADGYVPLFQLPLENRSCSGLVTGSPSYTFDWTGTSDALRIMFEGDGDSSLLVVRPDMSVLCSDDSADGSNLNPVIDINGAAQGLYAVYVGRINPEAPVTGMLSVTDQTDEPDVLAPAGE